MMLLGLFFLLAVIVWGLWAFTKRASWKFDLSVSAQSKSSKNE